MSDSDESEPIGYLAEQPDNFGSDVSDDADEIDEGSSSEPGSQSESESGSDDSPNDVFDLEAIDSDDENSEDSDEIDDEDDRRRLDPRSDDHSFPHFMRLPLELRIRIWEYFCPDLTAESRVYWFSLMGGMFLNKQGRYEDPVVYDGQFLEQQTRAARAMLAVHHQSRHLALKAFPDSLSFGRRGRNVLRFNSHKDIVVVGFSDVLAKTAMPRIRGFSKHIRHLALESDVLADHHCRLSPLLDNFENLTAVYYVHDQADFRSRHLRWCMTDLAKRYSVTTFEEQPGLGEEAQHTYCWPDVDKHGLLVAKDVPLDGLADDLTKIYYEIKGAKHKRRPVWPLVQFLYGSSNLPYLPWESSDQEEDDEEEPDEYESEGIDDSDISDDDDGSDDSDDHDLHVLDGEELDPNLDPKWDPELNPTGSDIEPHIDIPTGARPRASILDHTADLDHLDPPYDSNAGFSSPEQSSTTLQGSDNDESASESDQAPRTSKLKRPRGRVVASDSEDDSDDDGLLRKRARTENRGAPIVLSSDDEETEVWTMPANGRVRAVIAEDSDEEDEDEDEDTDEVTDNRPVISSSDEEDEDSEEAAVVSKPLSLAEKLQLHRERNPIPPSDDGNSDIEEQRGDDYSARDYGDFQDDDEGSEASERGEDDDEQEQFLDDDDDDEEDYEA
ncbi:hypothetical protein N657DRAFT_648960 [Parathielavia appendiculata]|uniref:2EXR domain-containing protein n=1 Tax=Parathielavia appendiculata TaxID=2587402 RepID=A0AAN6TUZ5_9PEZI|nr:hypothetical protein N657DRAFT_648960 [Parathielavia appendiculata]